MSNLISVFTLFVFTGTASAQSDTSANVWSHGTTASGYAGWTTDGTRNGPALGGGIGWEITPRFGLEGDGTWTEFGDGISAFSGSFKARARLFGARPVDPFVQGGIGFYRTSFSDAHRMPPFYERRMHDQLFPNRSGMSFTDPSLIVGGGLNVFINRHLTIRPAVDVTMVLRDRDRYVVTTAALQVVFHFEDHPVTPAVTSVPRPQR